MTMADNKDKKVLNVPALRFPEFTEEWESVLLEDVAEFQKKRISSDLLNNSNYISTENILQNFGGVQNSISIPANTNVIEYQRGDVLLSNIRPYLKKVWLSDRHGGCSADVFVLRGNQCERRFLYYVIASDRFINFVMSDAKGVKMPRGDKSQMEKFTFFIPTNVEQKKIAMFLSMLDERIRLQNKIIEKLETLIKGIRDYVLNNKLQNITKKKLGELCTITTGKLDANAMKSEGLYPFFTCAEEVYRIDSFAFDTEALLVSGNGANLGYIHYYKGKFNAYQRTYVLSNFIEDIHYIQIYLEAYLHKRIALEKSTSNTPYIVLATLAEMPIIIPNIKIQKDISNKILILKSKLITEIHIRNCYKDMRQFLLSQMFI